jgi:ABC-type multidrug transport system ATPase subunit
MDAVQISDVTKTFGAVTAVKDLRLNIPEDSIDGFTGPNGSGKTTEPCAAAGRTSETS